MRRVCGFDTLSAHLVRKSLSFALSLTLGVLPMAPAFAREDERTSYLANNRYQDYQTQYKPEKNTSASSQLDRQIRMQNTALTLRFQAPTATSLGRVDVPKPTYQSPTIKFDFLGTNAPKVPNALRATPEPLTAPMKPGLLNTIGNALKAVGHVVAYPFQKVGQGIAGLIQRAFGSGHRTTTLTDSQRATLNAYRNIQPVGDGTFKAAGGPTVAFGRTWEEGATFKVEGDQLRLIQGTSFERTFGGMERKDGGLMPLKMAEVNGVVQPTGLDFDRLAPNTVFAIKSPMTIEGFGDLKAGAMTYQGAWKSPEGQTTGGRFKFENTLLDLNKDLAHGMDMTNPVAVRQATFALQAGLMRLNSAVVEKGSGKYFVSQDESPVNIARLEKAAGELDKGSEASLRAIETTKQDIAHRTEALGASAKELAKVTGQGGPVTIDLNAPLADLQREAQAVRGEANRIAQALKAGDYAGLDTAAKDLAQRQETLTKKTEALADQAEAIKNLQKGYRVLELQTKAMSQKPESPATAQENANVEASVQIAMAAAKFLASQGAITPEQSAQLGTQITALRTRLLGAPATMTEATAPHERPGFFGRLMQKASDLKTSASNECKETAAKAASAATAAKALVADAANEASAWTMAVTESAAAKTVQTGSVVKNGAVNVTTEAVEWTMTTAVSAKQNTLEYLGIPPGSVVVNNVSENTAKVDMKLNWIDFVEGHYGEMSADVATVATFANVRWTKATAAAAPMVASLIDGGHLSLVDVPGVNSSGMSEEKMQKLSGLISLKANETMIVCHSAGTDACAQSMPQFDRDRSEVFFLILSPRMAPNRFGEYMRKGGVPSSRVITINSMFDFPHKAEFDLLPKSKFVRNAMKLSPILAASVSSFNLIKNVPKFWNAYESAPETGSHITLIKNHTRPGFEGLEHSSMYDGLTNGELFDAKVNGHLLERKTLPELINALRKVEQ